MADRRLRLALCALLLVAFGLRAFRLTSPQQPYFDETYYISAAHDYLEGRPDENNVHPPLAKLQIAAGMLFLDSLKAYGANPLPDQVAWRLSTLLAGTGTLIGCYWLAFFLTRSRRTAVLATFLLSFDFLELVQSRISMLDGIQAFWITLGLVACAYALMARFSWSTVAIAGLCFGVATACKWNGLLAAFGAWLSFALISAGRPTTRSRLARTAGVAAIFALLIPAVYTASYVPVILRDGSFGAAARQIRGFHLRMWYFRSDPRQFHHAYLSQFYQWPLVLRPVWYYYQQSGSTVRGVVALGSPIFWWAAALLLCDLICSSWKRKDRAGQFLVITYLSQWLLWALSTTGGFFYYMTPATPLMAIVVARELSDWWEEPFSRRLAIVYLISVVVLFALYFPFLTGLPVSQRYFHLLFFNPYWV